MTYLRIELSKEELLRKLEERFNKNMARHPGLEWETVLEKLKSNPKKLDTLREMEVTGGEPDVVVFPEDVVAFVDCSAESPAGRRSCCYDRKAWESRKQHKPATNAMDAAAEIGVEILSETQYRALQELGKFDTKTSSWIMTPDAIRNLGGALFCDRRYDQVFVYQNGADSYYGARGYRSMLKI